MPNLILVSACLLGIQTRYDGQSKGNEKVLSYLEANGLIPVPVCPEQLAGQPTPRPATRFVSGNGEQVLDGIGSVVSITGSDMNDSFVRGARETLKIARLCGCTQALLKERSPSCGVHQIYLGDRIIAGHGVSCALLRREGLHVCSEEDL
jgi:uncharacterized protein YbbK (DUF523 family)